MKYRSKTMKPGERVVHNSLPHGRSYGDGGWRYWTERDVAVDDGEAERIRCHCEWVTEAPIHYGTREALTETGELHSSHLRIERQT